MAVVAQNYPPPELNHRYQSQSIGASPQKAPGSRQSFDVSQLAGLGSSKTLSQDDTQRPMSFTAAANMNSFSQPAGAGQNPFPNPNNSLSHLSNAASRASIYTAVYSGVSVYEMEVHKVAVMRRRSDSWLNATQILKVAGVDKGKRTKILEKEILSGRHEKVQGGYGKYQGTWIDYQRGREFCKQYGVEELLRPLLEYDMGQDGTQAGNGNIETPTKEQAMAAQRKQMMYNGTMENRPSQTPNGTFFKNISTSAVTAIQAINKARLDSPGPRPGSGNKRPSNVQRSSQQLGSQESAFAGSSQQSMRSMHSEGSFGINGQLDSFSANQTAPYFTKNGRSQFNVDGEPPRKRARPSSSQDLFSHNMNGNYDRSMRDTTPTEVNESFAYHQYTREDPDSMVMGLKPLPAPITLEDQAKQEMLCSLFLEPSRDELRNVSSIDGLSSEDLDVPIDSSCHTALHWAALLAKPSLVRALIAKGANIYRVNSGGETALMRAALTTNNYEQNHFAELLDLLGPTIEMRDARGRTVLHHIAISSAIKGRNPACRYYLETLLEFVCRQGSASNSQQNSFNGDLNNRAKPKSIGLARFMSEIVNAQDGSGDTALNIAARINNKSIVRQLREIGGNPAIANRGGLKPSDFGIDVDRDPNDMQLSQNSIPSSEKTATDNRTQDVTKDIMSSITSLLTDTEQSFQSELQAKQSQLDQIQKEIRQMSTTITDTRKESADAERKVEDRRNATHQISNLKRSNEAKHLALAESGSPSREDVQIGDADAGLAVDLSKLPDLSETNQLSSEQELYLDSLPPVAVLEARLRAYEILNDSAEENLGQLKRQSVTIEKKLCKIVALCTNLDERKVHTMAENLAAAVASDAGDEVDTGRLRDFLRKVENGEI